MIAIEFVQKTIVKSKIGRVRMKLSFAMLLLFSVTSGLTGKVSAQTSPKTLPPITVEGYNPPSVEEIWKLPSLSGLTISRSGRYLAATASSGGRMNLVVIDLETKKADLLTSFKDYDVLSPSWVGEERIIFSLGQFNTPTGPAQGDGGGLFVVGRDGKNSRKLIPTLKEQRGIRRQLRFVRTIPGTTDEVIASGNMDEVQSNDLYRLNLITGKYVLISQGRPNFAAENWLVNDKLEPVVVTGYIKDTLIKATFRKTKQNEWKEINRFDVTKGPAFVPRALSKDGEYMQVATDFQRSTMGVFKYDFATDKLGELLAGHPRYDMGADASGTAVRGVILAPESDALLGYAVDGDKLDRVWLDEKFAARQASIDRALPNRVNSISLTPNATRFLVTSSSDVSRERWYLYDESAKTLEEIGASRPWLDGKLVEQRPFSYKSRDGLDIPGYYFLPPGAKPGQKFPTVVHIHGGPFARADTWGSGFGVAEGQLFASRGYAVVVPNFRITPGLGSATYFKGFGAFGRQMSDDHEDALQWAIDAGFVDKGNVCISGASYGGYAALWALSRPSNPFKCAIAGLAVTDLRTQLTDRAGDTADNDSGVKFWLSVLGANSTSDKLLDELSPINVADKIKKPVFFYSGRDDYRVPIVQIEKMVGALAASGNPPKGHIVLPNEGHGFGKLENRVSTWTKLLEFLDSQIGSTKQ
jgi:dipeptidyl aminopeptidase/acylaminoacyl peptidase